jgi:quercetin dioxygenase-like cupin family protein
MSDITATGVRSSGLSVSHLGPHSWVPKGRWGFFEYRDLGISEPTADAVRMSVTRVSKAGVPKSQTGWHYHECDLQVIYMLEGWADLGVAGVGVIRLEKGSCIQIPRGQVHNELAMSDDMEAIELSLPTDIRTVKVDAPADWDHEAHPAP